MEKKGDQEQEEIKKTNLEEIVEKNEEEVKGGKDVWDEFVKKVGLGDIIDDLLIRALDGYKKDYMEKNPTQIVDFSIDLKRVKNTSALFSAVKLTLHLHRNGTIYPIMSKEIKFQHIREAREGHLWKAQLYEAMFKSLMYWALTGILIQNDVNTGRVTKPTGA